jgi:hypothetical protein
MALRARLVLLAQQRRRFPESSRINCGSIEGASE